ncbi:MAG: hypothetical protein IPO27_04245 [Bacteroidetes bacterium]|nr:hypothetical protein [Bacteroidota bacterium]
MALFQFSICKNLNAQIYNDPDGNAHDSVLIFDRFGNTYDIRELQIPDNAALISMFNPCNAGIFRLDFMDIGNTGFNNTTDGAAYRAVACQVFTDLSELLIAANNPYTNLPNPPPFVDISLRAHTASTAVGIGSSFYNEQFNNVLWNNTTNRGLLDGEVWKTINGGINSFNSINLLVPSNVFHGFIELNFTSGFTLNTNFNIATPPGQLDVYEIILHEALHMLGITSFINSAGNSILAGSNFYTRFDSHLFLNNASTPLLNQVNSCGNQTYSNANLTPGLCNIRFIDGGLNLPVFSPAIFGQGQSLSHLDGTCAPVTSYVINNGGGGFGSNRRHPTQQEVDVLCALGYHCSSEYGIAGSGFENHFDTYTACGSRIAGVDDWFHFNTTNPYVYLQGNPPLLLDDFLLNDEDESSPDNNPHAYECPTIIYGAGNITNPLATSFEFQPPANYSGLAVIRYIPLDANGRKGNFAYIFVQVNDLTPDEACGNTGCNIVIDGCLEQIPPLGPPAMHYFINTHNLQSNAFTINGSTTNSPDRYGWDGFTWSRYPPAGVTMQGLGCDGNNIITIAQSHNGQPANNFYAGLINAGANQEGLFFQLNAPLQTGVTYSGSFWASRKDSCPTVVEIYSTIGIPGNVNTATLNLISSNSVVATYNTWDNYAFSYTHNVVGPAHEYLIVRVVPTQGNNYPYVFFDDLYIEAELNVTANLNHPCTGQNNGSIDLTVITPGGPYTFLWSNSSTNEDITNLAAGTYTVSVTDNHNCTHTYTYILNDGGCDPVSIIKTVQPTTTYAGDPVTYAITICNNTTAPITGTFSDIFGNPANFSINCNGTANPFDPPIPFILQPGCTTLTFTGCFVEIGNDQCNLAVFTYNGNTISSEACVDVLVGCPMIVSGFGDCAPGSKLNICYGLHTVVSNVNGFDGIIIYPDFLTPTATLASTSIPTSLGVISNVTFTNVGALSTYTDPLNCPGCVYRSMQVQLDYTGPQTFTAWPYTLGCFEFEITGTVPLGHNHFILSCQDPTTLVLNNTQLNTQAGPLHYWTQSGHLLLNGCPGMPALPDAGFNIDKLSCTGQVTVTATNTSSTAIHKWEFGDNRTTPVLGANPYTYDYFAPITHSSNGAIIPPIDPAPPGTYTITHTVFDGGLYNQSTQTIDLYPTCCPADVMIKSGESSSMYGSSILANTIDIEGVFNRD